MQDPSGADLFDAADLCIEPDSASKGPAIVHMAINVFLEVLSHISGLKGIMQLGAVLGEECQKRKSFARGSVSRRRQTLSLPRPNQVSEVGATANAVPRLRTRAPHATNTSILFQEGKLAFWVCIKVESGKGDAGQA